MGSPESPYKVRLDVSDFGPISEASVELRPLTVFVGPSNTGKTYLATLTYALHRFLGGTPSLSGVAIPAELYSNLLRLPFGDPFGEEEYSVREIGLMTNWVKTVRALPGSLGATQALPEEVATIVRRQLRPHSDWDRLLPRELVRCFGVGSVNQLNRYGADCGAQITITCVESDQANANGALKFEFGIDPTESKSVCAICAPFRLRIANEFVHAQAKRFGLLRHLVLQDEVDIRPSLLTAINEEIAARVAATMVSPLSVPAHFLPTDRTGTMYSHRAMVSSLVASASMVGLRDETTLPKLPGVVSDFLLQLLSIGNGASQQGDKPSGDFGANIEKHVLAGQIHVDKTNPIYPDYFYVPRGWKTELPLMNASSMVSELTPVVLFLRHVVKPGEVLIIEEPEAHLHPAMQVELMRQLATVVNAGVRIMITTHSEWILDELANLVRLSELPPEKRTPGLKDEPALDPRDVGVWLFERGEGDEGSHVKELPLDLDQGGFRSGYEDTARLTYNQWAAIHNLIQESTTT